jgi:hypothetical protein
MKSHAVDEARPAVFDGLLAPAEVDPRFAAPSPGRRTHEPFGRIRAWLGTTSSTCSSRSLGMSS